MTTVNSNYNKINYVCTYKETDTNDFEFLRYLEKIRRGLLQKAKDIDRFQITITKE